MIEDERCRSRSVVAWWPPLSPRHCERSEAIHSFFMPQHGLLRFARNDGGYGFAISRRISPEVCIFVCPPRKQRAQGRPGACCTRGLACDLRKQNCTRAYRAAGTLRPSLRNGFTAYFVLFPENGSFASVIGGTFPANVAPAPRRPNHTTSPYASGAYVYRALSVHRIPPHVRDVRERPSSAVRRAKLSD